MSINISEILSIPSAFKEYPVCPDRDRLKLRRASYRVSYQEPYTLSVRKEGSMLSVTGQTEVHLLMPCDRYLTDVDVPFSVQINRELDLSREQDEEVDEDELSFIDGCMLDADKLVTDEIVVALPTKILCREDCRGLCPQCGKNLNEGTCECTHESLDPRMAAIAEIFRNGQ